MPCADGDDERAWSRGVAETLLHGTAGRASRLTGFGSDGRCQDCPPSWPMPMHCEENRRTFALKEAATRKNWSFEEGGARKRRRQTPKPPSGGSASSWPRHAMEDGLKIHHQLR
jgi:hypothetical protein